MDLSSGEFFIRNSTTVSDFTLETKKVLQEVVIMKGGEKNAECHTCGYWNKLCHNPGESVCGSHTSARPN